MQPVPYRQYHCKMTGFAAPITASVELPYTTDSEKRYYIGKEKNMEACNSQIETVFESYAQNVGIELEK